MNRDVARVRESGSGRAFRIVEVATGRELVTTEQAVERSDRWVNMASLRSWIARHDVEPAHELNARTKLYYPEDLGLEAEDGTGAGGGPGP